MDVRHYTTRTGSVFFYVDGLCGRTLSNRIEVGESIGCYSTQSPIYIQPGELSECTQCLVGICQELSRNPLGIARE